MKSPIKLLVLDILKPHNPSIIEYAKRIGALKNMNGVNVTVEEIDERTETVKITVQGKDIDYNSLVDIIKDLGGTIHSVDEVAAGKRLIHVGPAK